LIEGGNMKLLPHDKETRMETGPVQFGEDWPGLFLRGDDCIRMRLDLIQIKEYIKGIYDPGMKAWWLMTLNNMIDLLSKPII
jgi:hypothetical protein